MTYHKRLVLAAVEREQPDAVVFLHSSYGWDLAPRVAFAMQAALISGIVGLDGGGYLVESCNGKMRRTVRPLTGRAVLTIQPGAFAVAPMQRLQRCALERMLLDRKVMQAFTAHWVGAPFAPSGEKIQPQAESGFEDGEMARLRPAARQIVAGDEYVPRLAGA